MENNKSKQEEYTLKILEQLQQLFEEKNENRINLEDFKDNDMAADFFHALANLAPTVVYSKLTQKDIGTLDFNHIANRLCLMNVVAPGQKAEQPEQTETV